jgi:hypothetical protein
VEVIRGYKNEVQNVAGGTVMTAKEKTLAAQKRSPVNHRFANEQRVDASRHFGAPP